MKNADVAERLEEIADLLDVLGERFKPEAYRRAARSIEALAEPVEAVAARGGLREIPGVGEAIDEKVREFLGTGSIPYLEKLRREVPAGLRELMRLPGLGPKTARRFWTDFGIEGPAELGDAIRAGRLAGAKGFGERKIAQLAGALAAAPTLSAAVRMPLEVAYPLANSMVEALRALAATEQVAIAGSFRRMRESVGDLDILVTSRDPEAVFDRFTHLPGVRDVRLRGPTKETVVLDGGLQVDLRVVEPAAFGAALQYFTGSKDHNVRLRSLARDRGLKINEYGLFRGEERIGGRTEEEVYGLLGLAWIPPELREDHGEIGLAQENRLPRLVEGADLLGDLHVHLPPPAGTAELETVLAEARRRSLRYVGIVIGGVDGAGTPWSVPEATRSEMRRLSSPTLRLFAVDEREGGTPADEPIPDYRILTPTQASDPSAGSGGAPVAVIAHLAGNDRSTAGPLEAARRRGAALEVGPGDRADANLARQAREAGVPLAVPALDPGSAGAVALGLGFARRAGAERKDVRNARDVPEFTSAGRKNRR